MLNGCTYSVPVLATRTLFAVKFGCTVSSVSVDVFNLFNLQEAVDVSERFSTVEILPANVPAGTDPQRAACLAGNDPTCVSVLQKKVGPTVSPVQSTDLNGNYKQPTLYQLPLSVRLGVKLTF